MNSTRDRFLGLAASIKSSEFYFFLLYASLPLRPGAPPPKLTEHNTTQPRPLPRDWTADEYKIFIEEARLDVASQQAEKRDIRARAQINLTTAILVAGLLTTSFSSKDDVHLAGLIVYGMAATAATLAVLASGGLISARSDIGTISLPAITHYDTGEVTQTIADGYSSTRLIGAETIAVMVTVLRDCVLALVLASAFLATAHLMT